MAWCRYTRPVAMVLPVPPQPTTSTRTRSFSSFAGRRCSCRLPLILVSGVITGHKLLQSLVERKQILRGKSTFAAQHLPHGKQALRVSRMPGHARRMGECTIKERFLPLDRGSNGLLLGNAHCSGTDRGVVVTVPVRRHA